MTDALFTIDDSTVGYLHWPVPHARDDQIWSAVTAWIGGVEVPPGEDVADTLSVFAERMATLARREQSLEPVRRGLRASAYAGARSAEREHVLPLAVLWHAATVLGGDPPALFREAAAAVGGSELLEGFAGREPADVTLEAFCFIEDDDPDLGFWYVYTG